MSVTGCVFDVQRGSFVDGPGIRTTIFFKGCNLSCAWCHNPEGLSSKPQLLYYENKCTHCGKCEGVCSYGALVFSKCKVCGKCAKVCPNNAREVCGERVSVDEVFSKIEQDLPFYGADGGVTFSGGECMLQLEFLQALLVRCKEKGIHTAVDTAGNVPFASFEKILPLTDLFLFDIKCASSELHKKWTGVDNKLIIENLQSLSRAGAKIWIRIPVIGGVNDNQEEMGKIRDLLGSINVEKIELLPYHSLGESKHRAVFHKEPNKFYKVDSSTLERLYGVLNG